MKLATIFYVSVDQLISSKLLLLICLLLAVFEVFGQDIPEHISYTRIYDYLDEMAGEKLIELNSAVKPYSRQFIATSLLEIKVKRDQLNKRQLDELHFFLNEFALEQHQLPDAHLHLLKNEQSQAALLSPAFNFNDSLFRARITPLLGMHITQNSNGSITKRWYGAELQLMMGENLSVYGSLRDISIQGALLARPTYLNDLPGYEYKESSAGGDFSDSRGGIKYAGKWGSIGLVKDNVIWGDNYHGSNILSGRAPSFPMLTLHLQPAKWFELNYFHGWLVSNVIDSTHYYIDNTNKKEYRMANKYMAANMFTFTPVNNLKLSVGNSIIYAEPNIQPAYLIPIAFYKSMDHTLTKGLDLENQNSQVFFNFSSRNIKHLHLYSSIYFDEVMISRFLPSTPDRNPVSYKIGANIINFPINNLSLMGEYTHNNIIVYKHSVPVLVYSSNSYNLGSYLGDNSQEIYLALQYKPIRGLDFNLSYMTAEHGNEYDYLRRAPDGSDAIKLIISQPVLKEKTWSNKTFAFNAQYELFSNAYAIINISNSDIRGYDLSATPKVAGENPPVVNGGYTAQDYANLFIPKYLQGKNTTVTVGFSLGF